MRAVAFNNIMLMLQTEVKFLTFLDLVTFFPMHLPFLFLHLELIYWLDNNIKIFKCKLKCNCWASDWRSLCLIVCDLLLYSVFRIVLPKAFGLEGNCVLNWRLIRFILSPDDFFNTLKSGCAESSLQVLSITVPGSPHKLRYIRMSKVKLFIKHFITFSLCSNFRV